MPTQILFESKENIHVNLKNASIWLRYGNNESRSEAILCYLQNRNFFNGETRQCPHSKERNPSADHLAIRCERMLGHEYKRRHKEVFKCMHMHLNKNYGFSRNKKPRTYRIKGVIENENATITVDRLIKTEIL